jgi:hypothetical protein
MRWDPSLFWLGELDAARAHLAQGIALYDPQQHRSACSTAGTTTGCAAGSMAP